MGLQTKDIGPDYYILMGLSLSLSLCMHTCGSAIGDDVSRAWGSINGSRCMRRVVGFP